MAQIIAFVGAGGKSALMKHMAKELSAGKYPVAITTTTKMFPLSDDGLVHYRGKDVGGGAYGYPGDGSFQKICLEHRYVLVEADDARHHPVKIPLTDEPVIPAGTKKIVVVMSNFALGRCFQEICQHAREADLSLFVKEFGHFDGNTRMTKAQIDFIAKTYYLDPLSALFPDAEIEYYFNEPGKEIRTNPLQIKKIGLVLLASGMSKRFGSNKLLYELNGKELYRWGLDALIETKVRLKVTDKRLLNRPELGNEQLLSDAEKYGLDAEVIVVSRFKEILTHPAYTGRVHMVDNPHYAEGISTSIRAGCVEAIRLQCDAVLYLVADEPYFTAGNLTNMIREYLVVGNRAACAYSDHDDNPVILHLKEREALLSLTGDEGALSILHARPKDTYHYIVSPEKLFDINEWSDIL